MQITPGPCIHRWRYFVDLATRAVKTRQCEACGVQALVVRQPLTEDTLLLSA